MIQSLNLNIIRNIILLILTILLFSLFSTIVDNSIINNESLVDPNWPYDTLIVTKII